MAEQCVILNDIHIDIMDYIKPAYCTEAQVSPGPNEVLVCALTARSSSEVCGLSLSGRIGLM